MVTIVSSLSWATPQHHTSMHRGLTITLVPWCFSLSNSFLSYGQSIFRTEISEYDNDSGPLVLPLSDLFLSYGRSILRNVNFYSNWVRLFYIILVIPHSLSFRQDPVSSMPLRRSWRAVTLVVLCSSSNTQWQICMRCSVAPHCLMATWASGTQLQWKTWIKCSVKPHHLMVTWAIGTQVKWKIWV